MSAADIRPARSDALPPSGAGTETILSIRELAGQLGTSHLHTHGYTMT